MNQRFVAHQQVVKPLNSLISNTAFSDRKSRNEWTNYVTVLRYVLDSNTCREYQVLATNHAIVDVGNLATIYAAIFRRSRDYSLRCGRFA